MLFSVLGYIQPTKDEHPVPGNGDRKISKISEVYSVAITHYLRRLCCLPA
jgi:hypothetical protein